MATRAELEQALKNAMRSGDDVQKSTLRMALSAIRLAEVEKRTALDEAGIAAVLQKELKSRQESIADAQRAGRPDLVAAAQAEMRVIESFLPQPLTNAELEAIARQVITEVGATSPKQMGLVMKELTHRLQGRATGEQASQVVRNLLAG